MINFYFSQSSSMDWTTLITSFTSAIVGGLIAGYYSSKATKEAHDYNRKLKEEELKTYEKATAISIVEELKVLYDVYKDDFEREYSKLDNELEYLTFVYSITQDFTTVYTQNAGEIGLIKDEKLRKLIIKCYICLKKYMEDLLIYKEIFLEVEQKQNEFISKVFPDKINIECSRVNNVAEIDAIKKHVNFDEWSWLQSNLINKEQVLNFIVSDKCERAYLREFSFLLKKDFQNIRYLMTKTYNLANEIYKD